MNHFGNGINALRHRHLSCQADSGTERDADNYLNALYVSSLVPNMRLVASFSFQAALACYVPINCKNSWQSWCAEPQLQTSILEILLCWSGSQR